MGLVPRSHSGWYAVRCVFRDPAISSYEERITLWRAEGHDEAIAKAEEEARDYAGMLDMSYLGLAQSYELADVPGEEGAEVFSLFRDSELPPKQYLDAFFDTGRERQGGAGV